MRERIEARQLLGCPETRQKAQARARVRLAIEDTLDEGLPTSYTPELYDRKVSAVFEHVYERFPSVA